MLFFQPVQKCMCIGKEERQMGHKEEEKEDRQMDRWDTLWISAYPHKSFYQQLNFAGLKDTTQTFCFLIDWWVIASHWLVTS